MLSERLMNWGVDTTFGLQEKTRLIQGRDEQRAARKYAPQVV
jgi:hypothetical protein